MNKDITLLGCCSSLSFLLLVLASYPANSGTVAPKNADGTTNAITLRGYVGRSTAEGYVSLYPSLDDFSESLEIAQADILHFSEVPESVMPHGAMIVWVKKDAQITHHWSETAERSELGEIRAGRLRIRVPFSTALRRNICASYCFGGCRPCHSGCTPCH